MPTYVYEVIEENGTAGERFEVDQPMSADPLTTHPMNGKPVRRVITGFRIAGKWSDIGTQDKLSDKNLDRIGFTKYVRSGDGYYEKTAGKGPNMISGNDDSWLRDRLRSETDTYPRHSLQPPTPSACPTRLRLDPTPPRRVAAGSVQFKDCFDFNSDTRRQ